MTSGPDGPTPSSDPILREIGEGIFLAFHCSHRNRDIRVMRLSPPGFSVRSWRAKCIPPLKCGALPDAGQP
ncbi:hypothetical protein GALLR39Z86_00200 [Glycomyces algeriensis]|uniref:Uncharacterized protein n=1 Tax=Glycomyces algeriensis TaxID=256037 RepID=A0A9W6LEL5_9ACTN|nr:hypothetical protein GALLR39Z86_00200 [Glycomyces algeriensis]